MQVEFLLLTLSLLFFISILSDKIGYRFGVPALLLFLVVGMLFGPDGFGFRFDNIKAAQGLGTIALCIILFSGGMDTKISSIFPVLVPGGTLATVGVLLTATITGVIIYYLFSWIHAVTTVSWLLAFLMASTMASTDSATVFSLLRNHGVRLKHNLRPVLELESGSNDPMAYILTITLISIINHSSNNITALSIVQDVVVQLIVGATLGFLFGQFITWLLRKIQLSTDSLYPIMVLTACIFIFSMTYYLKGNPYLAVYIGGIIIGNSKFTKKRQTVSFFDGLTWLSQLVMFLMLGLMVRPSDFWDIKVWLPCLLISFVMIFISRPLSVFISFIPFKKYTVKDKLFISWVGLKGAVPIFFAITCKAAGVPNADLLFNVVFLCTIVSLIIQGSSLSRMAKALDLALPPIDLKGPSHFDIDLPEEITSVATELQVTETMLANGNMLKNVSLPKNTLVILVRRGQSFFVPTGTSELNIGDLLLLITDDAAELSQRYMEHDTQDIFGLVADKTKKGIDMLKNRAKNQTPTDIPQE